MVDGLTRAGHLKALLCCCKTAGNKSCTIRQIYEGLPEYPTLIRRPLRPMQRSLERPGGMA